MNAVLGAKFANQSTQAKISILLQFVCIYSLSFVSISRELYYSVIPLFSYDILINSEKTTEIIGEDI